MSTMIAEVYNAFIQAKCPKDIAEKAAIAISSETKRESETIKIDIQRIELKVDKLDKELAVLKWMVGGIGAVCVTILVKLLLG